ncbi:MAG: trypsin-like peptidase domain-containing protein [Akkermansiaceae bacterium]|nr:trypsin-like peptidase domain-containing protein [Akkermansiaceae bacterium]
MILRIATAALVVALPLVAEQETAATQPTPAQAADAAREHATREALEEAVQVASVPAIAAEISREAPPAAAPADKSATLTAAYRGIVKIEVANRIPDYATPWQAGQFGRGNGTGFMVAPGLFMTNAHVVANAERIYVSPYADARKIRAKVRYVAHDADLALVEVENTEAFRDVPYLEFSDKMPVLEDEVRAIGYPIGGDRLSVTRGIVSRIDTIPYAHPLNASHLTVQVDAAINPGNSGGPVLMGDKVVGVAFQGLLQANSTGYMIPLPVIHRFLKDVEDGHYDRYVDLGVEFFPLENPAMRKHYKLADDARGALVADVVKGGSSDGILQPGDVVLAVNGLPVDSSAMIELDGERVKLEELAERSFKGDILTFTILRAGERCEMQVHLVPLPGIEIAGNMYDELPRYVQFAGLVFQPLQRNVVMAHHLDTSDFVVAMDDFLRLGGAKEREDMVILTKVLPDEVNARFEDYGSRIVTKVNGTEVKGLKHLYSLLYPAEGEPQPDFYVIEFKDASRPYVVESAALPAANTRISAGYNIPEAARL